MAAVQMLCETEGIIPALESAHAVAEVIKRAPQMSSEQVIVICLSGRGDKDVNTIQSALEAQAKEE
ncbi:tryptophan synthase subunit beta, partial [Microbacteriaceae bacterium K1510]|nr:tryptophan synthase subunit beta [Microbacteriaceae bacterium K1510]